MRVKALVRVLVVFALVLGVSLALGRPAAAADPVHWSYEGDEGPDHWGELSPDYALCATGKEQTPVDIPASAPLNPNNLGYSYNPSAINIFNNGHTIQVNYDAGSTLELEGSKYDLVQFHFHAHSEHTKAGGTSPIEMHLVHRNAEGNLAVVGVWLVSGKENAAFAPIFENLPKTAGDPAPVAGKTLDADDLLPAERAYYRYNGSLTTPPCTEGVKWVVLDKNVELSQAQIDAYTALFANNFRPVQSLNSRSFIDVSQPSAEPEPVIAPAPMPSTGAADGAPIVWLVPVALGALVLGFAIRRRTA